MKSSVTHVRNIKFAHIAKDGDPASMVVLDPPVLSVACDANGANTVALSNYTSQAYVRKGVDNDSGWTFAKGTCTGCNVTVTEAGLVTLTSLTSDLAHAVITATKSGEPQLMARLTVQRNRQGVAGSAGPYVPPPMRWSDYPDGYKFESGAPGETKLDCVLADDQNENGTFNAYFCKATHTKNANFKPGVSTAYWSPASTQAQTLISTILLLAQSAHIDLLTSNGIRIYDKSRNIVGQLSSVEGAPVYSKRRLPFFVGGILDPIINTFSVLHEPAHALDEVGKGYWGGLTGQHIEIDPESRSINIFDASGNICAVYSGRTLDVADVTSKESVSSSILSTEIMPTTNAVYNNGSAYKDIYTFTPKTSATVQVSLPAISVRLKYGQTVSSGSQLQSPMSNFTGAQIWVELYDSTGRRKAAQLVGEEYLTNDTITGTTKEEIRTIAAASFSFVVNKGSTYKVRIRVESTVNTSGQAVNANSGYVQVNPSAAATVKVISEGYWCEHGANGFYISTNSDNFIYALFEPNGALKAKCVSGGKTIFTT